MRSAHVHNVRKGGDCRFHNVEFAEHRRRKDVQARVVVEQVFSDIASTHVGCAAQCRFEISVAPVDGPIDQLRFFGQYNFHRGEINVSCNHEALHTSAIELRVVLGEIRYIVR